MKLKRIKPEAAKRAMAWDLGDVTARYQKDSGASQQKAKILERELKRFLIVCAESGKEKIGMKGPVDEYWHTFIIHTAEYGKFCDALCGHMIHHAPEKDPERKIGKNEKNPYGRFLYLYKVIFGETAIAEVWPQKPTPHGMSWDCLDCYDDGCLTCSDCSTGNCTGTDTDEDSDSDTDTDTDTSGDPKEPEGGERP